MTVECQEVPWIMIPKVGVPGVGDPEDEDPEDEDPEDEDQEDEDPKDVVLKVVDLPEMVPEGMMIVRGQCPNPINEGDPPR